MFEKATTKELICTY